MTTKESKAGTLKTLKRFTSSAPVDVVGMASALGVDVARDFLGPEVSGKIQRNAKGKYTIVVNASDSLARQRFTVAHELAHYLYHRDLIGDGVSDSPAYRAPDKNIYKNTPLKERHEWQANQFAANVLMPNDLLRAVERENPGITIPQLAQRFGVSVPAMRVKKGFTPYPRGTEEFGNVEAELEAEENARLAPLTGEPPF